MSTDDELLEKREIHPKAGGITRRDAIKRIARNAASTAVTVGFCSLFEPQKVEADGTTRYNSFARGFYRSYSSHSSYSSYTSYNSYSSYYSCFNSYYSTWINYGYYWDHSDMYSSYC